jgi:hypothetical protein
LTREYQQSIVSQFSKSIVELYDLIYDMKRYTNNNNKNNNIININKNNHKVYHPFSLIEQTIILPLWVCYSKI